MEINYHNRFNGMKVFHLLLQTKKEHAISDKNLKYEIIKWIESAPKPHREDCLKVRKVYNKPHYEAKMMNQSKKYLFVIYKSFPQK